MTKIFFVEDEPAVRNAIRVSIAWEDEGYVYCGDAPDGKTAFPLIISSKPDILITDIKMPFIDGLELSRLVKKELPHISVILMSGYDEFDYALAAIHLGVSDYILKPITPGKLLKALEKTVQEKVNICDIKTVDDLMTKEKRETVSWNKIQKETKENKLFRETIYGFILSATPNDIEQFSNELAQKIIQVANRLDTHFSYVLFDVIISAYEAANKIGLELPQIQIYKEKMNKNLALEEIQQVLFGLFSDIISIRSNLTNARTKIIWKVKKYVEDNYSNKELSLSSVSTYIGISSNYLSSMLHKETGETFSDFVNRIRIQEPIRLLKVTDLSIAVVSDRCGFNDQFYFNKVFKKVVGLPPGKFRKM